MKKEINQFGEKPVYFEQANIVNINNQVEKSQLAFDDILSAFNSASVDLSSYKNKFGNKIHIDRNETNDLYCWIIEDLKTNDSPIAVLAGNAGYGKSVILRDLFDRIKGEKIPVLGIKADRLIINNLDELNKELELGDTVESIFKALSNNKQKFVLLIDQIDALSQSLSSDRSSLNTYHRLILRLSYISNIRIVISCRLYDLDYDPLLQEYKNFKTFKTSTLSIEEITKVLESLNIHINPNAEKLKEFLRVPLHLQLFCKINNPERFSETITLQALYDEIWQEFILQKPNILQLDFIKIQKLVEEIANQMYDNQRLVVNQKLFEGKYKKELEYLSSEEIITKPERWKIQFIHQSFFDYAYARTFVENGEIISSSLTKQHQGLFIRSRIKQVFTYLRELNSQKYIQEFERVLFGNYRFHIKLLLINSLGFYSNPLNEEKKLVKEKIIKNDTFFKLFIESVYTPEWFRFLVKEIKIADYFNNKEYIDITYRLCQKMLYINTEEIITFLTELNDITFENKNKFIGSLLSYIPADKIDLSFPLYEKSKSTWEAYNIYHFLDTATETQPDFVIKELREQVVKNLPHMDHLKSNYIPGNHDISHIYEKLYEKHRDKAAVFFIDIIKLITEATKIPHIDSEENKDVFFNSMSYFLYSPLKGNHLYLHETIYDMVLEYLEELFKFHFDKAKAIILPLLKSDIELVLNFPISFMHKYPEQFKEESFKILSTEYFYVKSTEILDYNIKKLLGASYPLFSTNEQVIINKIILNLSLEWEKTCMRGEKGISKYGYTRIGYTSYQLISMIPEEQRKKYPDIDRFYKEKNRQYGIVKNEAPLHAVTRVGDTTMSKNAYEHMNDTQWKESFKKYISDRNLDWDIPTRTGHCRALEKYVSNNPYRFISLIPDIIDDNEILPIYSVYGIQGLIKANYDPQKTKELFVKLLNKHKDIYKLDREPLLYSVWITEYFIEKNIIDKNIVDFLSELVINYSDEEMLNQDPLQDGINRVRGAASLKLVQCYKFPQFKENIFSALETMAKNAAVHTRAAALYQMAFLNHLDTERNRNLFLSLISDYHPLLLKMPLHNLHPLIYFIHADFSKLIDFFTKASSIEESYETISDALFIAWLHNYDKSKELLDNILTKSDLAKQTVVKAAFELILIKKFESKCWKILTRFLNEYNEELGKVYELGFSRLDKIESSQNLENFIEKYIHSSVGKYRGYHFYKLLLKLSNNIPEKCIEWSLQFEEHEKPDIQQRMLRNEPLQVVIQSYNAIREYDKNNPILEKAMNAFDRMLTVPEYRGSANDVLQKIDA
ncbi:MAG: AAA family ATPase [Bacteroidales bacterium]|jgi:hypothetical protein